MKDKNILIEILNSFGYNINMKEINELVENYEKGEGKIVIFSRVSTLSQDLSQQTNVLFEEAKKMGFSSDDIIIIENKESAIKLDEEERIGIRQLKEAINNYNVECVMVYEISRISRRPEMLYDIRNYLLDKKINLICIKPYMRLLDPDGNMSQTANILFSLFSALSESEMMLKKERFKRGKMKKLNENKYIGGTILFGYKVDKETENIIIDKDDANTVLEIYERYVKNESIRSIAIDLMERGLLRYSSNDCARTMVRRILNASEYAGIKTTSYEYPQIISIELFNKAQDRKGTKCRSTRENVYYCKSIIHWKKNGLTLAPMVSRTIYGVRDEKTNDKIYVNMNFMDSLILDIVVKHRESMKGSDKKKMINEILDRMQQNNQKSQKATEDIEEITNTIDRINERIVKGKLLESKGDKMIDEQNKLFKKLTDDIKKYQNENKELDRELEKIMQGGNADYKSMDDQQKYNIIHEDISDILVEKDNIKRGGKYIEVILKDTKRYLYHLTKYGNYDILYIIENGKERRVEDLKVIKRFKSIEY